MNDVEWLDHDELETWMALVGTMVKLPAVLDRQLQQDSGINHFDYGIMSRLSDAPGRTMQMSVLAGTANGSLSRLSHAVKRLEERDWVKRSTSAQDGRLTEATLTDAGFEKVRQASGGHVALVRTLVFDVVSAEDLLVLRRIADAILQRINADPDL